MRFHVGKYGRHSIPPSRQCTVSKDMMRVQYLLVFFKIRSSCCQNFQDVCKPATTAKRRAMWSGILNNSPVLTETFLYRSPGNFDILAKIAVLPYLPCAYPLEVIGIFYRISFIGIVRQSITVYYRVRYQLEKIQNLAH